MAEEEKEEAPKKSSKKLIIFGAGGVILLLAVVAGLYFSGMFGSDEESEEAVDTAEETESVTQEAIYQALEPAFIVNYQNSPDARIMQIEMTLMARKQSVIDAVSQHSPVIRNNILVLLSGQDPSQLKSTEGKAALQKAIIDEVNKVLADNAIDEGIESVFFTSLVMQ